MDNERDEFTRWSGEPQWIGDEDFAPRNLLDGPVADVATAVRDEEVTPDQFRGLARVQTEKAAEALQQLGTEDRWPPTFWQQFLWSVPDSPEQPGEEAALKERVAQMLVRAPDELFDEIDSTVAEFVKGLASAYEVEREPEIEALWARAWRAVGRRMPEAIGVSDEPLTDAFKRPSGETGGRGTGTTIEASARSRRQPAGIRPSVLRSDRSGAERTPWASNAGDEVALLVCCRS